MKKLLLLGQALFCLAAAAQNWAGTNLTPYDFIPVTAMESHHGNLYATASYSLNRLNANNTSWTAIVTPTTVSGTPSGLKGNGSRLYMSTLTTGFFSYLYYTTDGGVTFTMDTVGLPRVSSGVFPTSVILSHRSKIIVAMGGSGYYIKDTTDNAWHNLNDANTSFVAPADPIVFYGDTIFGWDQSGGNSFWVTGNYGVSWSHRVMSNLPSDYYLTTLVADQTTGRLYTGGEWNFNSASSTFSNSGVFYSDDHGHSWTQVNNLTPFITHVPGSNNAQKVKAIYANDQTVYISLENNADQTAPNLLGTTSGLSNLAYDTLGLPTNAPGGQYANSFLMHQNHLTMAMLVRDVYMKGIAGTTGINEASAARPGALLYPNPCKDHLNVLSDKPVKQLQLMDLTGRVIRSYSGETGTIPVADLRPGIYLVQITDEDNFISIHRLIRE